VAAVVLVYCFREEDPCKVGKLTLKMTERATDLQDSTGCLHLIVLLAGVGPPSLCSCRAIWLVQVFFQTAPAWLIVGNALLWPNERAAKPVLSGSRINLGQVDPFVIGITGSYGKTSTKAILGKILECLEPTFWPPGSINTPMGITRQIGNKTRTSFAVIEMAAYGRGSIQRL